MQRIDFEQHCERCHSLNFDPDTPELKTPHGDPEKVLAYLHSLTSLYRDLGVNKMKISTLEELRTYVGGKLANLQKQLPDVLGPRAPRLLSRRREALRPHLRALQRRPILTRVRQVP